MIRFLLSCSLGFILLGCNKERINKINQGVLDYSIEYPDELKARPISNLLPQKLSVIFDDDRMKLQIKGDLNLFSLEFLSLAGGDSCYTVFRMLNRRMLTPMKEGENWFLFNENGKLKFENYKDSVKVIAGFKCFKVHITSPSSGKDGFDAWFTNQLSISSQMMRTPFDKVEGIPMAFEVNYNNHIFKFKASSFNPKISKEGICLPARYELATRKEIRDMVNMILN